MSELYLAALFGSLAGLYWGWILREWCGHRRADTTEPPPGRVTKVEIQRDGESKLYEVRAGMDLFVNLDEDWWWPVPIAEPPR